MARSKCLLDELMRVPRNAKSNLVNTVMPMLASWLIFRRILRRRCMA